MSRDPRYQRLLNSKRWRDLRRWYMQQHPLCERCIEEGEAAGIPGGYIRSAVDCHHIIPIERAKTEQEMERLAFDPNNLRALCIECHIKTHQEMNTHKKAEVKANRQRAFERWKEKMRGTQGKPSDPPADTADPPADTADPSADPRALIFRDPQNFPKSTCPYIYREGIFRGECFLPNHLGDNNKE